MAIDIESKAVHDAYSKLLGVIAPLHSEVTSLQAQRAAEYAKRLAVRLAAFPAETALQSATAVELDLAATYDDPLKTTLTDVSTKLQAIAVTAQAAVATFRDTIALRSKDPQ